MSSLQKFHRRTNMPVTAATGWVLSTVLTDTTTPTYGGDGSGSATTGYWLGNVGAYKLMVAPKSTESNNSIWGSYQAVRSTTFVNNGWANTNTLYSFGTTQLFGHPAAGICTALTTGGYNTWYLPAKNELKTIYSSKSKTPFATANSFAGQYYWTSTEYFGGGAGNGKWAWGQTMATGAQSEMNKNSGLFVRAVRRSTI